MSRVSVVMPAYFSHETLGDALAALTTQDRPPDEIVVVNSSNDEETRAVVAERDGVRLIDSPVRLLPHAARNRGLAAATGDVLVCTDPDCRPEGGWLRSLVGAVESGRPVVGGAMDFRRTDPPADRVALAIHLAKFWWALPGRPAGPAWIVPTANLAFTREAWTRAGPFLGDVFCGDALMSWRFAEVGCPPWFAPEPRVVHRHAEPAAAALSQRYARGREFGRERAGWERWSPLRRRCESLAAPLRLGRVMWLARRACVAAGWAAEYRATWRLHARLQAAWVAGESVGFLESWTPREAV